MTPSLSWRVSLVAYNGYSSHVKSFVSNTVTAQFPYWLQMMWQYMDVTSFSVACGDIDGFLFMAHFLYNRKIFFPEIQTIIVFIYFFYLYILVYIFFI